MIRHRHEKTTIHFEPLERRDYLTAVAELLLDVNRSELWQYDDRDVTTAIEHQDRLADPNCYVAT